MVIAVDFDGTIVSQERPYADVDTPLEFIPHAKDGLYALKRAGHILILYSARANRSLLVDPELDPLVRAKKKKINMQQWEASRKLHLARYNQMLLFVHQHLADVFDAIDDGQQGKPQAAIFIDDRAIRFGNILGGMTWQAIAERYGMVDYGK